MRGSSLLIVALAGGWLVVGTVRSDALSAQSTGGRVPPAATFRVRLMGSGATGGLIRTVHFDGTRAEVTFPS